MFTSLIGVKSKRVKNTVERGAVKKFADAIGDNHPIYVDEQFGAESRYGQNIAPPTFPRVFDYGTIDGFQLTIDGLIHGEQTFHYERPLLIGEDIYCYSEILDYYDKTGSQGRLGFLLLASNGEDEQGKTLFSSKGLIIITEEVRRLTQA
ncbi:MaoC family dehydratase N-terminal domain-containing protein [Bacillus suaedaesalsae]|uniref:MaoC family dehydratase N-terminal domain-containing protein n=1 Tax=Bacillus suaedaesalsae TaxID=2810349 RepID=A0ABS2DK72_9BACI|nr:MaoC family dehydratase N-terminal domain-containing protein [Bacillus suaedaesalsae]MBM6617921.1 MaoC family dehydratase N-terminal domain-containing protein [Bacillus suaedaesalsae]